MIRTCDECIEEYLDEEGGDSQTTQYALEATGPEHWHVVKVISQVSREVLGLCGHSFSIARPVATNRPADEVLCCGCRAKEEGALVPKHPVRRATFP
jgi:hypothetical protein